jgi:hypothetical protein
MAMLRRLPKILRFIPGTAQDVRVYVPPYAVLACGKPGQLGQYAAIAC